MPSSKTLFGHVRRVVVFSPTKQLVLFRVEKKPHELTKKQKRLKREGKLKFNDEELNAELYGDNCDSSETSDSENNEDSSKEDSDFEAKSDAGESQAESESESDEEVGSQTETTENENMNEDDIELEEDDDDDVDLDEIDSDEDLEPRKKKKKQNKKKRKHHEDEDESEALVDRELWANWPTFSPMFQYTLEYEDNKVTRWICLHRVFPNITRTQFERRLGKIEYGTQEELDKWLQPWQKRGVAPKQKPITQSAIDALRHSTAAAHMVDNLLWSDLELKAARYYRRFNLGRARRENGQRLQYYLSTRPDLLAFASEFLRDLHSFLMHDLTADEVIALVDDDEDNWPHGMPGDLDVYHAAVELYGRCKRDRKNFGKTIFQAFTDEKPATTVQKRALKYLCENRNGNTIMVTLETTFPATKRRPTPLKCTNLILSSSHAIESKLHQMLSYVYENDYRCTLREASQQRSFEYAEVLQKLRDHSLLCVGTTGPNPRELLHFLQVVLPVGTQFIHCRHQSVITGSRSVQSIVTSKNLDITHVLGLVISSAEALTSNNLCALMHVFRKQKYVIFVGDLTTCIAHSSEMKWGSPFHAFCTTASVPLVRLQTSDRDDIASSRVFEICTNPCVPTEYWCDCATVNQNDPDAMQTVYKSLFDKEQYAVMLCSSFKTRAQMLKRLEQFREPSQKNIFHSKQMVCVQEGEQKFVGRLHQCVLNNRSVDQLKQPLHNRDTLLVHLDMETEDIVCDEFRRKKIPIDRCNRFPMEHAECVLDTDVDRHQQSFHLVYLVVDEFTDLRSISSAAAMAKKRFVLICDEQNLAKSVQKPPSTTNTYLRYLLQTKGLKFSE